MYTSTPHDTSTFNLSPHATTLIIATSAAGGTVLLIFLVFVVWRLSQGYALVDVLKLRRQQAAIKFTDFPIHCEKRYSVRSSHYSRRSKMSSLNLSNWWNLKAPPLPTSPSRTDEKGFLSPYPFDERRERTHTGSRTAPVTPTQKPLPLPLPVAQRFNARDAYHSVYWRPKTATSPTTDPLPSGPTPDLASNPPLTHPDVAHMKQASKSTPNLPTSRYSRYSTKTGLTISIEDVSATDSVAPPTSHRDTLNRWSWTNSQAPSTPRWWPENSMPMPSDKDRDEQAAAKGTRYRKVTSWVEYQMVRLEEEKDRKRGLGGRKSVVLIEGVEVGPEAPAVPRKDGRKSMVGFWRRGGSDGGGVVKMGREGEVGVGVGVGGGERKRPNTLVKRMG